MSELAKGVLTHRCSHALYMAPRTIASLAYLLIHHTKINRLILLVLEETITYDTNLAKSPTGRHLT